MVQDNSQRIEELKNIKNEVENEKAELRKNQNILVVQMQKELSALKRTLASLDKYKATILKEENGIER